MAVPCTQLLPALAAHPSCPVFRTERDFRFMSIRSSAVRQYCCYSKTPTEENGHARHPRRLYEDRACGRLDACPGFDAASVSGTWCNQVKL
jgi:hypothetical protein